MDILKLKYTHIIFIFALILAVLLSGCSLFTKRYEKTEKKEVKVNTTGKKKVVLNNTNGDIRVIKSSADSVLEIKAEATFHLTKKELKEESEKIKLSVDTTGDVINIHTDYIKEKKFFNVRFDIGSEVNYELMVPEGIEVSIDNTNGRTEISGINNTVKVDLTNGDVRLTNITGSVSVDVTNGKVRGNLDSLKSLDIKTINGSVSLSLSESFSGRFNMETVNGKITKKDFNFKETTEEKKSFRGTLGSGDADVKIETTNGKITLKRK